MREQLQRIRRGELQLFLPLIENSIGHVYAAAKRDLPSEKVDIAVQNVFLKLYSDIVTTYRWQNAERFLAKSLLKACQKQRIDFKADGCISTEVPSNITRGILIKMSKVTKRRGKLGAIVAGGVVVALMFAMSYYFDDYVEEHAEGTIYTVSSGATVVSSYSLGGSSKTISKALISINPMIDEGVMIIFSENNQYTCELWSNGVRNITFYVPTGENFIGGSKSANRVVFADGQVYTTYDLTGKVIAISENRGYVIDSSPNNQFITYNDDSGEYVVYDILAQEEVARVDGAIFDLTNNGLVLYSDSEGGNIPTELIEDKTIMEIVSNEAGYIFAMDNSGTAYCYKDDLLLWQKELILSRDKAGEFEVLGVDILPGPEIVSFVISAEAGGIAIQACSVNEGLMLLDPKETGHTGTKTPAPLLSSDGEYLVVASQISEGYRSVRYLGAINLYRTPMREVRIPSNDRITFWEIETTSKGYYIYSYDSRRYLQAVFISNN